MILSYSIISSVILGFGYLSFRLFMSDERQNSMNRWMIQIVYGASLIIPFILLAFILHNPNAQSVAVTIEIGEISGELAGNNGNSITRFLYDGRLLILIYRIFLAGMLITCSYYLFGIFMLWNTIRKGDRQNFETFTLILVDDSLKTGPFCCFNSIVMRKSDYENDGDVILIHEYAHLRQFHWIDLFVAYLTICLQWYNPAAWAMREQMKNLHEYLADEEVISTGVDPRQYQMLLLKKAAGSRFQSFASSLNHSKLQKRVTMMYKNQTSLRRKLFALALIPAIGAGIAVTSIPAVAGVLGSLANISAASSAAPSETSLTPEDREIYTAVEHIPEYPGGMEALMQYLMNNIRYPESAMKANEQGRVIINFVVNKDGSVSDPEILKGVSDALDKEAVRVVESLPKWSPGTVNGKPVDCYFTLPVNFRLQNDTKKEEANKEESK